MAIDTIQTSIIRSSVNHTGLNSSFKTAFNKTLPLFACAILLALPGHSKAVDLTSTWMGGTGNWNDAANWDTPAFPNNSATDFYTAIIDSDGGTASIVTSTSFIILDALVIDAGDLLQFNNDIDMRIVQNAGRINSGMVMNNGQIKQNSVGNFTEFGISGLVSFSGSGQFTMGGHVHNRMIGASGGIDIVTNSLGHTINGGGSLGTNSMGLINQGLVDANMIGIVLNLDPGAEGFVNQNIMQASNQGVLRLSSGNFDNTAGTIQALDNSTVQLDTNARIEGGTLTTMGTGIIEVRNDQDPILAGVINNTGTLFMNSQGNSTDMRIDDAATLNGNGRVTLGGHINNRIFGLAGGDDVLTNGGDHTIDGGGQLGANALGIVNEGTIDANINGKILHINPNALNVQNNGVMQASNGGILRLADGNFDGTGGGIMRANDNGRLQLGTNARIIGGTFTGPAAGSTAGIIEVANDFDPILAGTITNNTQVIMNSAGNLTDLRIDDNTTLQGNGRLTLGGHVNNRIYGLADGNDVLTNAANHTIDGAGQLGTNGMGIVNNGTIDGNDVGKILHVNPDAQGVQNNGVMQASNDGILRLADGNFDGTGGGIMRANDNGRLQLGTNARIIGGTFTGPAAGSTAGIIEVANDFDPILAGTITNNTQIIMNSAGNLTDLRIDDNTTLQGNGRLTLGGHVNNRIYGLADGNDVLTNAANHTIDGAGQLGTDGMGIVNNGTIDGNDADKILHVNPDIQGVQNNGVMQASNDGILRLADGNFDGTGGGIMSANNGGRLQLGTNARIVGGTFTGAAAGENPGIIEVANDFDPILAGIITNNTQVIMNSAGNFTDLRIDDATTLQGNGRLTLGGNFNNRISGRDGINDLLTNGVNHTIDGGGQLGRNNLAFNNKGTIDGNRIGSILYLDPGDDGLINTGTLQASNSGTLRLEAGNYDSRLGGVFHAETGGSLQLGINARIIGGTFTSSGTGVIEVSNDLDPILAGIITNNTQIIMNSAGNFTDLRIDDATTLQGNGRLTLGGNFNNRISGRDGSNDVLTNGVNHTIDGGGQLGRNNLAFNNKGTIDGNKNGSILYLDPGVGGVLNTGTLQASDNGILRLEAGDYDSRLGGVLHAETGGQLQLGIGARIIGGTFTSSGTGVIEISNDLDPIFAGDITNQTQILMKSAGNFTDLRIDKSVSLSGSGRLTLNNNFNNRISGFEGGGDDILTNGVNHTIDGGGQLGRNSIGLMNKGTIRADVSTRLTIDVDGNGFVNEGTLQSTGTGGILIAGGDFENKGIVDVATGSQLTRTADFLQTAGKTTVNGTLDPTGTFLLQGGELGGNGIIASNVLNTGGTVGAGNSPGELTINGNYDQDVLANMIVEIAGMANGEFDVLSVTGIASLDGGLEVILLDNYIPQIDDEFDILLAGTLTGEFDLNQLLFPTQGGVSFDISYLIPEGIVRLTTIESSAVPVPAALWLFASGLIGLVGVARRKKV